MENEQELPQTNGHDVDDYDGDDGDSTSKQKKPKSKPATMRELIMRIGCLGNFAWQGLTCYRVGVSGPGAGPFTQLSTAKQVGRGMAYGSCGLGALNSPVVIYKERQLTNEDTFRTALNGIREEQGRLTDQNDILSAEIDGLQSEVDRMKDVEMALRELSETQGTQLNELMELIKENKEINEGMRKVLRNKALEEVIGLVLDIDNDGSFTIEDKEIDRLIIGMRLIDGISFDEKIFYQEVVSCGGSVDEVITMIKQMIHGAANQGGDDGEEDGEGTDRRTSCTIQCEDPEKWFEKQRNKYL